MAESINVNRKAELLSNVVEHVDIASYDARPIIDSMKKMSFTSRDTGRAAEIFNTMIADKEASVWLTLAGSTSAGGCMHVYRDMVKYGMVDAIVATGAVAPLLDLGPSPNALLIAGTTLVIISLFMYALPPRAPRPQPGARLREV